MSEVRTLARCGQPVEPAGRPCMRVSGHYGPCICAANNAEELAAIERQIAAPVIPFTRRRLPKLPAVYLVIFAGLVALIALQAWIDAYVLATIFG